MPGTPPAATWTVATPGDLKAGALPSTTAAAYSLTIHNASSSHYTLTVMTWVALLFTPVVLAYQGWTYWVFRHRVGGTPMPSILPPKPCTRAAGRRAVGLTRPAAYEAS